MPRAAPDPKLIELVLSAVRSGVAQAEVARQCGVSKGSVSAWVKRYGGGEVVSRLTVPEVAPPVANAPRALAEPAEPDAIDDGSTDPIARCEAMQTRMLRSAAASESIGNMTAAQRSMRDASNMAVVITRLRRDAAGDREVLHISQAEIAEGKRSVREKIKALVARPLLCAHCGRALSVELAELDPESA